MFPRRPKPTDKLSSRRHKTQSPAAEEENHMGSTELEYEVIIRAIWEVTGSTLRMYPCPSYWKKIIIINN